MSCQSRPQTQIADFLIATVSETTKFNLLELNCMKLSNGDQFLSEFQPRKNDVEEVYTKPQNSRLLTWLGCVKLV